MTPSSPPLLSLSGFWPPIPSAAPLNISLIRQHGEEMEKLISTDPFSTAARNAADLYLSEIFQSFPIEEAIQKKILMVPTRYLLSICTHINPLLGDKAQINRLEGMLKEISNLYDQLYACNCSISTVKNSVGTNNFFEDVDTFLINASGVFGNIDDRVEAEDLNVNHKEKLRFCTRLNNLLQRGTDAKEVEKLILELIEYKKHYVDCVVLSCYVLRCNDIEKKRVYVQKFLECFAFFHPGYSYVRSLHMFNIHEQEELVRKLTQAAKVLDAKELEKMVRLSLEEQGSDSADDRQAQVRIASITPHPIDLSKINHHDFLDDPSGNPNTVLHHLMSKHPESTVDDSKENA